MQYETILKNGFAWIRDKQVWIYVITMIALGVAGILAISFFVEDFLKIFLTVPVSGEGIGFNLLSGIIQTVLLLFVFGMIFSLIEGFLYTLILLKGMNFYKIKTASFGIEKYIKLIILQILSAILAWISYYDKRFFMVFIAIIVSYIIAILLTIFGNTVGFIILMLAILATIIYMFVVIYNSIRLSMAPFVFLEKEKGIFESLREGWNLTHGKVIDILIAAIIIWVIIWIASTITGYFGQMLISVFFPGFSNIGSDPAQALQMLLLIINNFTTFLLVMAVPSLIIGTIMKAFEAFGYAGIYSQVNGKPVKQPAVKKKSS